MTKSGESRQGVAADIERPHEAVVGSAARRDAFLGRAVFSSFLFVLLLSMGFFAYLGMKITESHYSDRESIAVIADKPVKEESDASVSSEPESGASSELTTETPVSAAPAKETVAVSVLNGGAASGSAGKVVGILTKAGFSKAVAGDADGDYSGLTVYYSEGQSAAADLVKGALIGSYPSVTVKPADPKHPETSKSPVVVIVGA
ncbi:MAG: LytR C-terminal domain-containing protein [Candidatus Moranbacteria bacterium]|nr:LytR C-terminal domain-containing protein [Candidatus Moranbacteria bacterium]